MSQREAIKAELMRRGLLSSSGETAEASPLSPLQQTPPNPLSLDRKAIEAELMRRGLLNEPEEEEVGEEHPSAWQELGRGALSGLMSMPLREAADEAEYMINPELAAPLRDQADYLSARSQTPMGRIAHNAGAFGSSMLASPTSVAKSGVEMLKSAGKSALAGGGIGAVSGVAQEFGVPPVVADIGSAVAVPPAAKAVGAIGKTAASFVSPAVRDKMAQEAAKRDVSRILQETTQGVDNPHTAINVPEALSSLSPQVVAEDAGEAIRGSLEKNLGAYKKARAAVTEPLYKNLKQSQERVEPQATLALLKEKMETAKGSFLESLKKIDKDLHPNVRDGSKESYNRKILEEYKNVSPRVWEMLKSHFPTEVTRRLRPAEIDNVMKDVSDRIKTAYDTKAFNLAKELEEIKEGLEVDLKSSPSGNIHRQEYARLSTPVDEIERHRTLGKVVEKNPYQKGYKLGEAELPQKFISASKKSIKDAQDLLQQIGNDKEAMESVRGHIHKMLLDKVLNKEGKVELSALESWRKSHSSAFILYPQLETKLKNLANAQFMVNQILAKSNHLPTLEAFEALPSKLFKKVVRKIAGGDYVLEYLSKIKDAERTGVRNQLLQESLMDPSVAKGLLTPVRNRGAMQRFADYLQRYTLPLLRKETIQSPEGERGGNAEED